MLQKNLKEEYRAVVDYEVAFFNTVRPAPSCTIKNGFKVTEVIHFHTWPIK